MENFPEKLPEELTDSEQQFVMKFKKLHATVSNEDMLRWAVFHVDWRIPYPDFPVFDLVDVPPGTDPAIAKAEWEKKVQTLKAKLWKRMFAGDEPILALGPISD